MIRTVGWVSLVVLGVVLTINGIFMLISPRAWFRLPEWIRAQGSLTESKYASGWGAIAVRMVGAAWLAGIGWVLYSLIAARS
jgi:hypothetical protein